MFFILPFTSMTADNDEANLPKLVQMLFLFDVFSIGFRISKAFDKHNSSVLVGQKIREGKRATNSYSFPIYFIFQFFEVSNRVTPHFTVSFAFNFFLKRSVTRSIVVIRRNCVRNEINS